MNEAFEAYAGCRRYFGPPRNLANGSAFILADPPGWVLRNSEQWSNHSPKGHDLGLQGWKLHVSAPSGGAIRTLRECADVCHMMGVPFKHLRTHRQLRENLSKRSSRAQSGKFVTLYPPHEIFDSVARPLRSTLVGREGPYILSDLRIWEDAPIFTRFGAFTRQVDRDGRPVLITPDGAEEVDVRAPWFECPTWASKPRLVVDAEARRSESRETLPFDVSRVLRTTNAGGLYEGEWHGKKVIIKEARPGIDHMPGKGDVVKRLRNEADALKRLGGIECVPERVWGGSVWEHEYLVMTQLDGVPLDAWVAKHLDLYDADSEPGYLHRALRVITALENAVDMMHRRGVTHLDLHPGNVLVRNDDSVFLLDFEFSGRSTEEPVRQVAGSPGFHVDGIHPGAVIDWVCVRQLATFLLRRLAAPSEINPNYWRSILGEIPRLGLTEGVDPYAGVHSAIRGLEARIRWDGADHPPPAGHSGDDLRDSLCRGLEHARGAAPAACKRVYPAHPYGIEPLGRSIGLAYGDACIDLVLGRASSLPFGWFDCMRDAIRCGNIGVFDGVAGEIFCRALLTDGGQEVSGFLDEVWAEIGTVDAPSTVWSGMPGVLLVAMTLAQAGMPISERIMQALPERLSNLNTQYRLDPGIAIPRVRRNTPSNRPLEQNGGLFHGHLGWAWLFARGASVFDDSSLREDAVTAARRELASYVDDPRGGLQRLDGHRRLPYLATGSAGFGTVLAAIGPENLPEDLRCAAVHLDAACAPRWATYPGLFNGHAGLTFGRIGLAGALGAMPPDVGDLIAKLRPHLLVEGETVQVAGDAGFRVTCDMASGAAGILLALEALKNLWSDPLLALVGLAEKSTADFSSFEGRG